MNSVRITLAAAAATLAVMLASPASADEPALPQPVQDCLDRHPTAVAPSAVTDGNDLVCVYDTGEGSLGDDTYLWVGADTDDDVVLRHDLDDPGVDTLSLADWTVPHVESYNEVGYGGLFGIRVFMDPEAITYTAHNDVIGDPGLCGRVGGPEAPEMVVRLGSGADTVNCTFATIYTEGGDDVVNGVEDNVVVFSGSGADEVHGDAGADAIRLGSGADRAYVKRGGADVVRGGLGADVVYASRGDRVTSAKVR